MKRDVSEGMTNYHLATWCACAQQKITRSLLELSFPGTRSQSPSSIISPLIAETPCIMFTLTYYNVPIRPLYSPHKAYWLSQFSYTPPLRPFPFISVAAREIKSPVECYRVVSYPQTNDLSTMCYAGK